jgi:hypothetical protein
MANLAVRCKISVTCRCAYFHLQSDHHLHVNHAAAREVQRLEELGCLVQWLNDLVAYMKNQGAGADGQHSAIDNWFWCVPAHLHRIIQAAAHKPASMLCTLHRLRMMLIAPHTKPGGHGRPTAATPRALWTPTGWTSSLTRWVSLVGPCILSAPLKLHQVSSRHA